MRCSVHILEYENYGGYDKSTALIRESDVYSTLSITLPYIYMQASAYQSIQGNVTVPDIAIVPTESRIRIPPDCSSARPGRYL
jgi:hypothetical protein